AQRFHPLVEGLMYRSLQEAIANARKHAQATSVRIVVRASRDELVGIVEDDGRGFDLERTLERDRMHLHLGLDTMIERVRLAGGGCDIDTAPGRGTNVTLRIPLNPTASGVSAR